MNVNNLSVSVQDLDSRPLPVGFIDNLTFGYLTLAVQAVLNPALGVLAFIAALINVATFSRMNMSQGVNQNLLILSTSDFVLAVFGVMWNSCYVMMWLGIRSLPVRYTLRVLLSINAYPINGSMVVTAIIAVVRCLSVVMPLSFRTVVTARRQLVAIVLGCGISWCVPMYTQSRIYKPPESYSNPSNFSAVDDLNRHLIVLDYFRNSFFYTCLIVMSTSGMFLSMSLRKSSKFQAKASSTTDAQSKVSRRREVQVVQTIILLLVIFVTCNLPFILLSVTRLTVPGFSSTGKYRNELGFVVMLISSGIHLNVGLNTFVYVRYNSHFRNTLSASVSRTPLARIKSEKK
ncbi:chemosensory receptor B [Elysia marginata]|uniref:Chemosensory receptor B n=1 Tax=Elysia marginata TaxID=1093978 RepID=A0AAV4G8Q3_9GAST|nr:chemosensory receptor B [Elysia marginata]